MFVCCRGKIGVVCAPCCHPSGSGDLDVFVANFDTNQILTNDGSGNFTAADAPSCHSFCYGVAIGDLDGDGDIPAVDEDGLPNLGDFLLA